MIWTERVPDATVHWTFAHGDGALDGKTANYNYGGMGKADGQLLPRHRSGHRLLAEQREPEPPDGRLGLHRLRRRTDRLPGVIGRLSACSPGASPWCP